MNGKSNLQQRLAVLLREAERARGDYEKSLGHRDDDWPDWYAHLYRGTLERPGRRIIRRPGCIGAAVTGGLGPRAPAASVEGAS